MLRSILSYMKRYPLAYLIVVVGLTVDYILWVVPTRTLQAMVDVMTAQSLTREQLNTFLLIMVAAAVIVYVTQGLWNWNLYGRAAHYVLELKQAMYYKILGMRIQFFEKFRSGDMVTRFTNDIQAMDDLIGYGAMTLLLTLGTYLMVLPIMCFISWRVTLLALLPATLALIPITLLTKHHDDTIEAQREAVSALSNEVLEVVEGIRVTRAYANKEEARQRFQNRTQVLAQKADQIMVYQALMGRIMIAVIGISTAIIMGMGSLELMAGRLSLGQIIALQLYSLSLADPLWSLTDLIVLFQTAKISYGKIDQLLTTGDDLEADGLQDLDEIRSLELRDYGFRYQQGEGDSLRQIHLRLMKGQTLGIVGKTGSGKTTLVRQFLRQYPVGQGEFLINDQPITDYARRTIESKIGYVPQEHLLFSRSVAENIRLGRPEASQKELDVAVAIAAFSQDLERMSSGYDTLIGEKGVAISGGQKQRISIARAMIKEPELLILDDALSAVDARTERVIIENIQTLRAGKTNIITTHRLSAVQHADWIIVLDQGRIVEEGRAEDLIALGGWYAEQAWRQQLSDDGNEREEEF